MPLSFGRVAQAIYVFLCRYLQEWQDYVDIFMKKVFLFFTSYPFSEQM